MPTHIYSGDQFVTRLPVEERNGRLYALGVPLWLEPPCRIPEDLNWKIDDALNAERQAAGVNMPVALVSSIWLHRCRRCNVPFIGPSEARLCSDQCRAEAKRNAVRKSKAKRAGRHESRNATGRRFVCRQCGKRTGAARSTKQYCSMRCRVAAHRRVPAQPPEPMTLEELDAEIADMQSLLGAAQCGYLDAATLKSVIERVVALQAEQAERAKLMAEHPAAV